MAAKRQRADAQVGTARLFIETPGYMEVCIAALAFVAYMGSLTFEFVSDDRSQVLNNPEIHSWASLPGYFTHAVWSVIAPYTPASYYRPIFFVWLRANYMLFGTSSVGWHASLICLNIIVCVLMFRYVWRLLGSRSIASVATLLFVLHPVHVESVAWISGATDPLMAALMLISALAFLQWSANNGIGWYALSFVTAFLAIFTKETAVLLPILLVATALTCQLPQATRPRRTMFLGSLPFFALIGLYLGARGLALHAFAHNVKGIGVATMVESWPAVLAFYIRQLVFPVTLSPYYDLDFVTTWRTGGFWLPLLFVLPVLAVIIYLIQKASARRQLWTAALWLVLPLLPALYLRVFSQHELVHDRYLYLPSLGLCILLAVGLERAASWFSRMPSGRVIARAAYATIFILLGIATVVYQTYWVNDLVLYTRGVKIAPMNDSAVVNLGVIYIEHGQLQRGMAMFQEEIARYPGNATAVFNLGRAEYGLGDYRSAETLVGRSLVLTPDRADWWLMYAGIEVKLGKYENAEAAARRALAIDPNGKDYHVALGAVLFAKGDREGAAAEFRKELALDPRDPRALQGLAQLQSQ